MKVLRSFKTNNDDIQILGKVICRKQSIFSIGRRKQVKTNCIGPFISSIYFLSLYNILAMSTQETAQMEVLSTPSYPTDYLVTWSSNTQGREWRREKSVYLKKRSSKFINISYNAYITLFLDSKTNCFSQMADIHANTK